MVLKKSHCGKNRACAWPSKGQALRVLDFKWLSQDLPKHLKTKNLDKAATLPFWLPTFAFFLHFMLLLSSDNGTGKTKERKPETKPHHGIEAFASIAPKCTVCAVKQSGIASYRHLCAVLLGWPMKWWGFVISF